ncbi:heterokaryon incompatibility protein-domain-containing protein [Chaetomidium leptoderma]|uniref:Heterokaryon incompatibility protein-domain-containing protein n=1 Tax=Chaetomidium leptoderma TaxID=669021 RepID=A0AAN6ZXP6_9PEZI|nr:heterokaryon incompatibility protein-domain-containing protein [Chaetomidium leptoderma]
MALPLSSVSRDDNVAISQLSLRSIILRAPFHGSSRQILAHIIGNRLPAFQRPRPLIAAGEAQKELARQKHLVPLQSPNRIFCRLVPRNEKFFLFHEYRQLVTVVSAATAGCHFCNILKEAPHNPPATPDDCVYLQIVKSYDTEVELYVTIAPRLGLYKGGLLPQYAGTKFDTSSSMGWFKGPGVRNQAHDAAWQPFTGSAQHLSLAKSWLSECTEKHQKCRRNATNKLLPARFIQFDQEPSGQLQTRLYATTDSDQNVPYCALSHCWGGVTNIPLLKSSNIGEFMAGIDFASLPKSFRDAVIMAHTLGIEYIWIDSICIIQDSKEDWLRESARMGHVYEYAACTIMSAAAQDPHGGLFQHRPNPLPHTPCRIAGSPSDGLFVLPHGNSNTLEGLLKQSPLQSRAWCFQESYLSPRKLYFGPTGIYWTCFTGEATELTPQGRARTRAPRPNKKTKVITGNISTEHGNPPRSESDIPVDISQFTPPPNNLNTGIVPSHAEALADFHSTWLSILTAYSGRNLTKQSDKLVAIAGIASRLAQDTGFTYLAGLWRETLLLDLVWHVSPPHTHDDNAPLEERRALPPDQYVAPTWSWAGLGVGVQGLAVRSALLQPELATVGLVEVKGVEVTMAAGGETGDGTGAVEAAVMRLVGKLKGVGDGGGVEVKFEGTGGKSVRRGDLERDGERMGWIDFDVKPPEGAPLYVLPVVEHWDWSFSSYPPVHGLALVKKGEHYERVGSFEGPSLQKDTGTERWEWLHGGESVEVEIW